MISPLQDASEIMGVLFTHGRIEAGGATEQYYRRAMEANTRTALEEMADGMNVLLVEGPRSLNLLATENAQFCVNRYKNETSALFEGATREQRTILIYLVWYVLFRLTNPETIQEFLDLKTLVRDFTQRMGDLAANEEGDSSAFKLMVAAWNGIDEGEEDQAFTRGRCTLKTRYGCAGRVHLFLRKAGLVPEGAKEARDFRASPLLKECFTQVMPDDSDDYAIFVKQLMKQG